MINKKCCVAAMLFMAAAAAVTGCSEMTKNPMKYILDEDETREGQTESDTAKEDTSKDTEDNKNQQDNTTDIYVFGTDKVEDYSSKNMVSIAREINDKMSKDSVKGVILIQDKAYVDDMSFFLSLTVQDKKPLIIIPHDYSEAEPKDKVARAKEYINGSNLEKPEDMIVNSNSGYVFDISDVKDLPSVDIVYDYVGSDSNKLSKSLYINDGTIVVSSTSDASVSPDTEEVISQSNAGPVVITCSEDTLKNNKMKDYGGNIYYTAYSPTKARILTMLLLQNKCDSDTIRAALKQNWKSINFVESGNRV
ncbi:MAG: hypothetical protein ACI4D1_06485 [Lachnospira sp.]